jgi:UTP-glucose-1-phosphate uridylyltransferase
MHKLNTLVILAGGNGSRFGGAKQFARFGVLNKTLMEYNLCHALAAGFDHVVFITQAGQQAQLTSEIIAHLPRHINIEIVIQALDKLPTNCQLSKTRTKPLGTAHALWCARHAITGDFVVINADDYYGKQAFELLRQQHSQSRHYAMVAYLIQNTLSEYGGVNRGLCQYDTEMKLQQVSEVENIKQEVPPGFTDSTQTSSQAITGKSSESKQQVTIKNNTLVSMNCWAFTSDIFPVLELFIINTLRSTPSDSVECYLPNAVMTQLSSNRQPLKSNNIQSNQQITVQILTSHDDWFGVTYAKDSADVEQKINALSRSGAFDYLAKHCNTQYNL